ncbi:MAG: transposase [Candidatus Edwardsbacteria bacterium]|nr:transposase [Candidatus Edwardsbacteria bacterium]
MRCSERWIQAQCKSGKLNYRLDNANGGQQYRILLDSLPAEAQARYWQSHAPVGLIVNSAEDETLPAVIEPTEAEVSEAAKDRALSKVDLIKAWDDYRAEHPGQREEANNQFLELYAAGKICPGLLSRLGPITRPTLYRWKKSLGPEYAWRNVLDGYYKTDAATCAPKLSEEERNCFLNILLHQNRIKVDTAYQYTAFQLQKTGQPVTASKATFRRFAEWYSKNHHDVWTLARDGQKALRDKVVPYIKRDAGKLEVGQVLVADGHRLNFRVLNPFTGKPCRPTMVGYVDWKSGDLAGYEIMLEENTMVIASALRNSILNLGKIPQICYQDNGKAFRSKYFTATESLETAGINGLFASLGITTVFARAYNAKAKVIEPWWHIFTNSFERLQASYVGAGIDDKPAHMMRNEKFMQRISSGFVPTLDETIEMINAWLDYRRSNTACPNVPGMTIGRVFDDGRGPGVDPAKLDDLLLASSEAVIRQSRIRFLGEHYEHDSLYGLSGKVRVKYSLFDRTSLKVYHTQGQYICTASKAEMIHPMARVLGNLADQEKLKDAIANQKALENRTIVDFTATVPAIAAPKLRPAKTARAVPAQNIKHLPEKSWGKAEPTEAEQLMAATGTYDLSAMAPPAPPPKQKLYLFDSDMPK